MTNWKYSCEAEWPLEIIALICTSLLLLQDCMFPLARLVCEHHQDIQGSLIRSPKCYLTSELLIHIVVDEVSQLLSMSKTNLGIIVSTASNDLKKWNVHQSCGQKHSRLAGPFRDVKCRKFGKLGHIRPVCMGRQTRLSGFSSGD